MVEGKGPGFGRVSQKELQVSCTSVHWCSEPAADPSPQSWLVIRAQCCPFTASGKVAALSLSSPAGLEDAPAAGSHGDTELKERAASSHPAQGAPQTPSCWHCRHAACSPKAPHGGKLIPTWYTNPSRDKTRANSAQSQPEMYGSSKAVTPKSSVKSPTLLGKARARRKKLQKHRLRSQNMTQM